MIDMHSHILPGIDDGARDLQEALELLRLAEADGVTTQVVTPHIHPTLYSNTRSSIKAACAQLAEEARKQGLSIRLEYSAEIRICPEITKLVETDEVPWLGVWEGCKVLLLEFPYNNIPVGSLNLVNWLTSRNIIPMLAHPERIVPIQHDISKLRPFLEAGCLLQITAASLVGNFGTAARDLAVKLLKSNEVSLIATDCHNTAYRRPILSEGMKAAANVVGREAALAMVMAIPQQMRRDLAA